MGNTGFIKGLPAVEEAAENEPKTNGKYIRYLTLKDGESAFLRFLTDKNDLIQAPYHTYQIVTPKGEQYRSAYCTKADTGVCPYCAGGKTPSKTIFLWAFVYYILHKNQNRRLETDPNAVKWTYVKFGEKGFYKEEINAPMIFRTGIGKSGYIRTTIINFAAPSPIGYDTLIDRDYRWSRTGSAKEDTSYSLGAKDPSPASEAVLAAMENLPELADVVTQTVKTFGDPDAPKTEEPAEVIDDAAPVVKKKATKKSTEKASEDSIEKIF